MQSSTMSLRVGSVTSSGNARFLPETINFQNNASVEDDGSSLAAFAKDFVIMLLLGTVGLICLMLVTYLLTMLMDWLSPRWLRNANDDAEDETGPLGMSTHAAARAAAEAANRDIGTLTRKAHLWGLHVDERQLVLHKFFQQRVQIFGQSDGLGLVESEASSPTKSTNSLPPPRRVSSSGHLEMGRIADSPSPKMSKMSRATSCVDLVSRMTRSPSKVELPTLTRSPSFVDVIDTHLSVDSSPDQTDLQRMCCICLLPYERGSQVMTGTQCQHMYHFECCQAWLVQHDHCPYCRQEMLRPAEFRQAAVEVLGDTRVNQLLMQHIQSVSLQVDPSIP